MNRDDRLHRLDSIRGLCVVLMVGYHLLYTLFFYMGLPREIVFNPIFAILQPFFAGVFIFISGISSQYSRSNLKRGFKLLPIALAVTAVTIFIENPILFGILHFLSLSMIFYGLTRKVWDKIPLTMALPLYAAGLLITRTLTGVGNWPVDWLFPFGFFQPGFFSADYFPILPWIFVFLAGTSFGALLRDGRGPQLLYEGTAGPLSWIGRHALVIYILHQPILVGTVMLIQFFLP